MATKYTIYAADPVTFAIRDEIPFQSLTFSDVLNSAGSLSCEVSLNAPQISSTNLKAGDTALFVVRNGTPVWAGFLWTMSVDPVAQTASLSGEGLFSYYSRRGSFLDYGTNTMVDLDTADAPPAYQPYAGSVLYYELMWCHKASGYDAGVPNIDLSEVATAGTITGGATGMCWKIGNYTHTRFEARTVADTVNDLSTGAGTAPPPFTPLTGFDFAISPTMTSAGVLGAQWKLWYGTSAQPTMRRGQSVTIPMEFGGNLLTASVDVDGSKLVKQVVTFGSGESSAIPWSAISPGDATAKYDRANMGLFTSRLFNVDAADTNGCFVWAQAYMNEVGKPHLMPQLTLRGGDDAYPAWGDYGVGDTFELRLAVGQLVNVDGTYRIGQKQTQVDANGSETVTITVAENSLYGGA